MVSEQSQGPYFSAVDSRAQALRLWMYPGLTPAVPREKPHFHMPTQPPHPLLKEDFLPFQHKGGLARVFKDLTRKVTDKTIPQHAAHTLQLWLTSGRKTKFHDIHHEPLELDLLLLLT